VDNGIGVLIPIGTKLTNYAAEAAAAVAQKSDVFFTATTVEDLAKQMGVDPAKLRATVDGFNKAKDVGYDAQFHRPAGTIRPVKTGKLYAMHIVPMNFVSIGGIKVNLKMEATDTQDRAIPGLYVVGADAGGLFGDTYTLWTSGFMFQWSVQSGMIAGGNAAVAVKR